MLESSFSRPVQNPDSLFTKAYKGFGTSLSSKSALDFDPMTIFLVEKLCQKIRRRVADGTALPSELENLAIMEAGLEDATSGNPDAALNNISLQQIMDAASSLNLKVTSALIN